MVNVHGQLVDSLPTTALSNGDVLDLVLCNCPYSVAIKDNPLVPLDVYHPALSVGVDLSDTGRGLSLDDDELFVLLHSRSTKRNQ